jgi:hypothetical protein
VVSVFIPKFRDVYTPHTTAINNDPISIAGA